MKERRARENFNVWFVGRSPTNHTLKFSGGWVGIKVIVAKQQLISKTKTAASNNARHLLVCGVHAAEAFLHAGQVREICCADKINYHVAVRRSVK